MNIGSSSACWVHVCFRAPACPVTLAKDGEQLGVAFQDVSQLFLAGAMLIVGVPKLGVHGQEPVKMLPCLLSKPHTRWQGSWTQHIT